MRRFRIGLWHNPAATPATQSNAANFRLKVNAAFLTHKDLFKRVSRGQNTAV